MPSVEHDAVTADDDLALFPECFSVIFRERESGMVRLSTEGGQVIGDLVDDRSWEPDGYRYHDIFHFAYAAVLGWSPVTRTLLGCRRTANRDVSLIEDGARAKLTEEGVALLIFAAADRHRNYRDLSDVPDGLIRTAMMMTGRLEVADRGVDTWRRAIHIGFDAWASARDLGDARVDVDTIQGQLRVSRPAVDP